MTLEMEDMLRSIRALGRDFEEQLCSNETYRALRQLDDREAKGEPLEAIDGAALRARMVAELERDRLYRARRHLDELLDFLSETSVKGNEAAADSEPQPLALKAAPKLGERLKELGATSFDEGEDPAAEQARCSKALVVYAGGAVPVTVQRGLPAMVAAGRTSNRHGRRMGRLGVLWRVGTSMAASVALIYFLSIADAWASRLPF